ncbi:MAG TPA: zinc-dependent alcohol dehydrogenase family protein [Acidobacteriaceae bacterium]|jgi:NADPH:quinone reductase-like Zn-dependent oxidoreductase|nr:zinc-dependent alcohol dehydrogenase family protein [Acidobacteriaceae bacterium]
MPKAVRFYEIGGPEKLMLEEEPQRQPGEGEVRLRVQATGLNRAEMLYMRGQYFEQPKLPSRIGYEAAGVVDAVGPGVDRKWLGKQVATFPGYSMNQYGVLGEDAIVPLSTVAEYPERLSPVEGAALWMKYGTAWGALVHYGQVTAGDFVVIPAASSSVGLAAIQIVKDAGGIAIATTRSSKKKKELLELGADHVIATEEEDLPARVKEITGGKGARLIFDPVAGPFVEQLAEAAAPGGIIFEYGVLSMQPTPFPTRAAMTKGLSIRGYTLHQIRNNPALLESAKKYIYDRLADGRFVPKIAKTFPLAQSREAYEYLESNAQVGKVVITVP